MERTKHANVKLKEENVHAWGDFNISMGRANPYVIGVQLQISVPKQI